MAELKKCPFCGGEAFIYHSGNKSCGFFKEVICKKCGIRTERLGEDLAIEAWNNRVTESEIRASVIDEFAEKAIKIVYEANNRKRNPQPRDMVADIHFKLMDLAEQLKGGMRND